MRKMTKTVATLAAMSAMTVASASLAFAAEKQVEGLTGGTWSAQANGGWKYKTEAGVQLKDTWAEIDGVWYYFKGDVMAKDRFLVLDDKGYFFDGNGRLATGWQKISSKMDAYGDLSISEDLYYPYNNGYETVNDNYEYDYHDFVWCYFDESGVAKENEWFNDPSSGRWYYFDENIMVKNVFNYEVQPDNYDVTQSKTTKYYGFDENGAMMTGWNSKKTKTTWNNPTADDKGDVWYYYKENGQMQKAGWAEIDGDWYLFADMNDDAKDGANDTAKIKWLYGGYPLIVNSYVASYKNDSSVEYFYVNGEGKLQSDVQNVKKAWKVLFYNENNDISVAYEKTKVADKDIYVNFSDKGFAAKKGVKDNYYYAMDNANVFKTTFGTASTNVTEINNKLYDATAYFADYDSLVAPKWSFTDTGVASQTSVNEDVDVDNEIVDYITAGSYVNTTDFSVIDEADYDALPSKAALGINNDKTDYFVMADTASSEAARNAANVAYTTMTTAKATFTAAETTWNNHLKATAGNTLGDVTLTADMVTGYDTDIITGTDHSTLQGMPGAGKKYYELVSAVTAKKTTAKNAYNTWAVLKKQSGVTAAQLTAAWDAYEAAQDLADEYELVRINAYSLAVADVIATNIADHNDYEAKLAAKDAAVADYNKKASAALAYAYSDFVNKWDVAIDTEVTNFAVVGERVKNAFIAQDTDKLYMVDGDGKILTNKAVLIDDNAGIVHKNYITGIGTMTYNNAYLVFGSDGLATVGYTDTKKTINIGGVAYWSTGETVTIGKATATIFVADKKLNSQY